MAQAGAELRIERRQGHGIGTQAGKKLVAQARALRERIGREVERVKDWVMEHFPDALKQIKERSRDVLEAVAEKVRGRRRRGPRRNLVVTGRRAKSRAC